MPGDTLLLKAEGYQKYILSDYNIFVSPYAAEVVSQNENCQQSNTLHWLFNISMHSSASDLSSIKVLLKYGMMFEKHWCWQHPPPPLPLQQQSPYHCEAIIYCLHFDHTQCPWHMARRGGVEVACWTGLEDPGSIPGLPSPRVGPLMARRLKTSSDVRSACVKVGPAEGQNLENWTTVPLPYSWNIAECDVKPQPTKQPTHGIWSGA